MLTGSVFVTGGAGYLGRGLMRRSQRENWDCEWTIFSRDEEKQRAARDKYKARYVLGDVCDYERLRLAMLGHDIVIHAAAAKYIPQAEANPSWCVRTNIDGTRAVIDAARSSGVKQVVVISTDKAPSPANVYGMTKAICERLVGEAFEQTDGTKLVACRYGNVVGSSGSIWPSWTKQAEVYGFIGLTDPAMTRYFMGVEEAIDIILAALAVPTPGLVVLPAPRACNMGELARHIASTLGSELREVGRRPGEKTHEQMVADHELNRLRSLTASKYFGLLPPGYEASRESDPPAGSDKLLSSADPQSWITPEQFVEIALDSETV